MSSPAGRLWHRLDDRYALPKSSITLLLRNAAVSHIKIDGIWRFDTSTSIQSTMISGLFSQGMAQETYDANLAGLSWSLSSSTSGLSINCSGYSDRLSDLALKVLKDFFQPGVNSPSFFQDCFFDSTKDRFIRGLETYFQSRRSDSHAIYYRDLLMSNSHSVISTSLSAAKKVTLECLKTHHSVLLDQNETSIECLYTGNVTSAEAIDFFEKVSSIVDVNMSKTNKCLAQKLHTWVPGK